MRLCQEYQHFISLKSYDFLQGNNCILDKNEMVTLICLGISCVVTQNHIYM